MRKSSVTLFLAFSIAFITFATACGGMVRKGDKPSEDWSRSVVIGDDAVGSIGMAVAESGESAHLVWPYMDEGDRKLRYVQLDEQASVMSAVDLAYPGHIRSPRLVMAGAGKLHLFWVTRQEGVSNWELWYQLLAPDGRPTAEPAKLTERGENIGRFDAYSDGSNGAIVIWDSGNNKGLNASRLNTDGDVIDGPHQVSASGGHPTFRVDPEGSIHAAWLDNRSIFYSELQVEDLSASEPVEVVDLDNWGSVNTTGDDLQGPSLGYADGWIYLFWSIVSVTDTEAGTGVAEYAAFPKGSPSNLKPDRIWAIPSEDQPYIDSQNSLALTKLSQPRHIADAAEEYGVLVQFDHSIAGDWADVAGAASSYMLNPATMMGQQKDLAVALAVSQEKGSDTHLQIATTLFSEGQNIGYNFAGKTSYISDDPILAADRSGNLFVAWREGASGETIYFAATTAEAKSSLDRLGSGDLVAAVPQGLVDGVSSIAFFPFAALCWVLPGFLFLGGWQLVSHENNQSRKLKWLPVIIALLLYYGLKLAFLPTFTSYIPLSAWLYIPPSMEEPMRLGFPLLILAASIAAAAWSRRRFGGSMLVFFLSWVATDGLLTLIFYGVNLMGTF